MIETKVPKDIRKFKGKVLGPFSFRQTICISIAIVVDTIVYMTFLKGNDAMSSDTKVLILMFCALPILSFSLEVSGMSMEVYIRKVLYKNLMYPTKRKVITNLDTYKYKISDSELKEINKKYQERIKEEPEWKMYE